MDEYCLPSEKEKKQNELFHQDGNVEKIYSWLDTVSFSKPPRTLARDFADGILMAELLKIYYPRLVELHNCIPASNVNGRKDNWGTLNRKVFSKIGLKLNNNTISQLANCHHGTIEKILLALHAKVNNADVDYFQEQLQDLETDEINETKIENIELLQIEGSPETEYAQTDSQNLTSEREAEPRRFLCLWQIMKNSFQVFMTWFLSILFFWKKFFEFRTINENLRNEIACNNNYPLDIGREPAYLNVHINDTASRWAYEQLIQEIHEKEDIINTLNHKIAYLEGMIRQKDLRIANLLSQITNNSVEILNNTRQRLLGSTQIKLRPKSHNSLMMPTSYGS